MRIVLDTNILARAAGPSQGPAREALLRSAAPPHVLVLSAFIVSELDRVLRYDRVRRMHGMDDAGIEQHVANVQAAGVTIVLPTAIPARIVPHDPDDDPIIATAFAGQADVICTRDRHLHNPTVLARCQAQGLRIVTDIELLELLRAEEKSE